MNEIYANQLADLINDGFSGQVQFEGCTRVEYYSLREVKTIYRNQGVFTLHAPEPTQRREEYELRREESVFLFNRGKGKVSYSNPEKYGPIIGIPIDFAPRACLIIEPRGKILF